MTSRSSRSIDYHLRLFPSLRARLDECRSRRDKWELLIEILAVDHSLLSDAAKVCICKHILKGV